MTGTRQMILAYLIVVNLAAFFLYGADKRRAREHRWRIPERTLLGIAAIGGSIGALAGMYTFRHKTRRLKFTAGVPALLLAQIIATVCWLR